MCFIYYTINVLKLDIAEGRGLEFERVKRLFNFAYPLLGSLILSDFVLKKKLRQEIGHIEIQTRKYSITIKNGNRVI